MLINLDVSKTVKEYESLITKLKKSLQELPDESICSRKRNGNYTYCLRIKKEDGKWHEKYLSVKDSEYIRKCCEAAYLRKLIPALLKEKKALEDFLDRYNPEAKYDAWTKLPDGCKELTSRVFHDKKEICRTWEYGEFDTNPMQISDTRYVSKKGEVLRSRIELIVADMLYDLGIPYRYECRLDLASGYVFPDFTIMHPETLELYYIEIFGMMDDPKYESDAFRKISRYASSDVYSHLLMFFDHKDAPISPVQIKHTLGNLLRQNSGN